jgi:hypothetical protein
MRTVERRAQHLPSDAQVSDVTPFPNRMLIAEPARPFFNRARNAECLLLADFVAKVVGGSAEQ